MKMKLGSSNKLPGESIISFGGVICVLTVVIFVLSAFSSVANGLLLFGGGVLGLLTIAVGYLKRIAVAVSAPANTLSTGAELK